MDLTIPTMTCDWGSVKTTFALRRVNPLDAGRVARHSANMALIYKIFRADEYAAFVAMGETEGAPVDLADGYIHFSTAGQLAVWVQDLPFEDGRHRFKGVDV